MNKKEYKKIGWGLVHEIFLNKNRIYKIPKDNFAEFHSLEHFKIERGALNLLRKKGLPSVKIFGMVTENKKPVLVEEYIKEGYQKKKGALTKRETLEILSFIKKSHKIKIRGYGQIDSTLRGKYNSWREFILKTLKENLTYLISKKIISKKIRNIIKIKVLENLNILRYDKKGSLIITDINPLNFFFKKERLIRVIDIDHPLSGDPLYEYGSLRWYHEDIFTILIKSEHFDFESLKRVLLYELFHAISVICWMHKNNLKIAKSIEKFRQRVEDLDKSLISLSSLTLLILKPEVASRLDSIKKELVKRGYVVIMEFEKENFSKIVNNFYERDYPRQYSKNFQKAYRNSDFGEKFYVLILKEKFSNSINSLNEDVGNYKDYRVKKDNSLRSIYGLPPSYNYRFKEFEMFFNGFHKIDNIGDFIYHLKLLKIRLI